MAARFDLHTHSDCSDGKLSPQALVELAIERGVATMALTDHDTVEGIVPAESAAGKSLEIIPGIELSCLWRNRLIHVLGLKINIHAETIKQAAIHQKAIRVERAKKIAHRLTKAGVVGSLEGAQHYAANGVLTRPHFAQYLVDANYVDSINEAFKKYLGDGKAGDVHVDWPSLEQVCRWIMDSEGFAVLAHPDKYDLTRTKLYELVADFKAAGGAGIEVISGKQDREVTQKLAQLAEDFDLAASCGSDFHRHDQSWQSLGDIDPLPAQCRPIWEMW